jgi:hypothetical protein
MSTQAPEIDGVTLINDFEGAEPKPGQIRRLRVTEAHDYDLIGTLIAGVEYGSNAAPADGARPEWPGAGTARLIQIGPAPAQIPVR